jgi:hypothetical protein
MATVIARGPPAPTSGFLLAGKLDVDQPRYYFLGRRKRAPALRTLVEVLIEPCERALLSVGYVLRIP